MLAKKVFRDKPLEDALVHLDQPPTTKARCSSIEKIAAKSAEMAKSSQLIKGALSRIKNGGESDIRTPDDA